MTGSLPAGGVHVLSKELLQSRAPATETLEGFKFPPVFTGQVAKWLCGAPLHWCPISRRPRPLSMQGARRDAKLLHQAHHVEHAPVFVSEAPTDPYLVKSCPTPSLPGASPGISSCSTKSSASSSTTWSMSPLSIRS